MSDDIDMIQEIYIDANVTLHLRESEIRDWLAEYGEDEDWELANDLFENVAFSAKLRVEPMWFPSDVRRELVRALGDDR